MDAHLTVELAKKSLEDGVDIPTSILLDIYLYAKKIGKGLHIRNYRDTEAFERDYEKYKEHVRIYETEKLGGIL